MGIWFHPPTSFKSTRPLHTVAEYPLQFRQRFLVTASVIFFFNYLYAGANPTFYLPSSQAIFVFNSRFLWVTDTNWDCWILSIKFSRRLVLILSHSSIQVRLIHFYDSKLCHQNPPYYHLFTKIINPNLSKSIGFKNQLLKLKFV